MGGRSREPDNNRPKPPCNQHSAFVNEAGDVGCASGGIAIWAAFLGRIRRSAQFGSHHSVVQSCHPVQYNRKRYLPALFNRKTH